MAGEGAGPEVMQVMQQIAASIGSYSANQAAAAPASAADILEGAAKEFLVRLQAQPFALPLSTITPRPMFHVCNSLHQSGSDAGAAAPVMDFSSADGADDEELNGPMQVRRALPIAQSSDAGSETPALSLILPRLQELLNMMVSKTVLYEPVKELCDKFPAWLQCNACSTPPADLDRY